MDDERENFSTATSNILLRSLLIDEKTEKTGDFYTTEVGTQEKYVKKLCQRIQKNGY